jgi:ABC-type nickel/cobalt efflux system permease component RcnA
MPPGADGSTITWRGLLALGISGGLLPCPSALVVLLGAIALGRVAFGLLLILMFSLGLATVLTAFGILLLRASKLFERIPESGRYARYLAVASAAFITLVGAGITVQALLTLTGSYAIGAL